MTSFESNIRKKLETIMKQTTWCNSDGCVITDMVLCNEVTWEIPREVIRKILKTGILGNLRSCDSITAYNIKKGDSNCTDKTYKKEEFEYYMADIPMKKDNKKVGKVTLRIRYNAPEDCKNIIEYKFIPNNEYEETIEFIEFTKGDI